MDCEIAVFVNGEEDDERVTLVIVGSSIVEYGDDNELVPACTMLPAQAKVLAEALVLLAKRIEEA